MKFFINIENVVDHPAFRLDVNEVSGSKANKLASV
jgi:hypothetical protein